MTRWLRRVLAAGGLAAACGHAAWAGIPAAYQPMVVQPTPGTAGNVVEFDLRPALLRARREGHRLYVYLGATDCPYCRQYEAFLAAHTAELVPPFAEHYLVVDLRSRLDVQAPRLVLRTDTLRLPYAEFQRAIGDQRARLLVYPSVWLLDGQARPLMQMPAGTGTFQTVPEQLEILNLVE